MGWLTEFAEKRAADVECQRLMAEWLAEVEAMRAGDDSDWQSWSEECRGNWARSMLDIAADEGFLADAPQGVRTWLQEIVENGDTGRQRAARFT